MLTFARNAGGRGSHIAVAASQHVVVLNASSWGMGSIHTTIDDVLDSSVMSSRWKSDDNLASVGDAGSTTLFCNISDFGAIPDTKTGTTVACQRAVAH